MALLDVTDILAESAQNSTGLVQRAGAMFGEQSTKLVEQARLAEQQVHQLTTVSTAASEQAWQIRATMEEGSQKLTAKLTEAVSALEVASDKLKESSESAISQADHVAASYSKMTEVADIKLTGCNENLEQHLAKAEGALSSIGANITQQASTLSLLGEQMGEQQRTMAMANDSQR